MKQTLPPSPGVCKQLLHSLCTRSSFWARTSFLSSGVCRQLHQSNLSVSLLRPISLPPTHHSFTKKGADGASKQDGEGQVSSVPFLPHRQPVIVPISIPSPASPLTKLANVLARLRYALSECISMLPLHALPVQTYTWGELHPGSDN